MFLFSIFIIFVILINPIFNCILFTIGIHSESGQLQIAYIAMFIITMLFVIKNYCRNTKNNISASVIIISIITFLFFVTRYFYNIDNSMYKSEFLCWGASSLPATLCGSIYAEKNLKNLHLLLPWFLVPLTIIISYVSFTTIGRTSADRIIDETTGLNYQSISYYMSQLFGLTIFCLLIGYKKSRMFVTSLLYALLVLQFITSFYSGGRGGLVLLIIYLLFFLYKKIRSSRLNINYCIGLILFIIACIIIIIRFDILNTTGFSRLIDTVHQGDSNRAFLRALALESFKESPIFGHGTGSVFFEIGTYSHNFITDILVENGLFGLSIIICFIIACTSFLIRNINNYTSLFVGIIFIYAFTLNSFSGYWLANHVLWFVFGYFLTVKKCI